MRREIEIELDHNDYGTTEMPSLNLVIPEFTKGRIDAVFSLELMQYNRQDIAKKRENLSTSDNVIFIGHAAGLGDQIQVLRYASTVGKRLDRQITCTISPDLAPLIQSPQFATDKKHCKFVTELSKDEILRGKPFIMQLGKHQKVDSTLINLAIYRDPNRDQYDVSYPTRILNAFSTLLSQRVHDQEKMFGSSIYMDKILDRFMTTVSTADKDSINYTDAFYAFQLHMLGITVKPEDLNGSLFSVRGKSLPRQDIDLLVVPDAKDLEVKDAMPSRSRKSLTINDWDTIFAGISDIYPLPQKVGVVIGKSNMQYTEDVFIKARNHLQGWEIERISGDLVTFGNAVLRSKIFLGMDSGTTHLASEIALEADSVGHHIKMLELFYNTTGISPQQYGIRGHTDAKILVGEGTGVNSLSDAVDNQRITRFILDNLGN